MRILHCLRAPIGGLFRHVLDLAGEQAALGHEVGIIADSNAENRLTSAQFEGIAPAMRLGILRTPMGRQPGVGDYRSYRKVLEHARNLDLDVLHGHGAKGGTYARFARRALHKEGQYVRAFYTPHGGSLNLRPGSLQSRLLLAIERMLERNCDGLIFESAFASRVYGERVGRPRIPVRIIPNGLQPSDFFNPNVDADATDFLFIGELRGLKGVLYLLEALAGPSLSAATATIVGSGPDETDLKEKAAALGIWNRVRFTGALPAQRALRMGRVMVVPSLAESFPYVVLEAAAAGLPIVSTSVGGIPEIVDGTDTTLVAPGRTDALARAMAEAQSQPSAILERARRLKDNVARKFTVQRMANDVLAFYALTRPLALSRNHRDHFMSR